MQPATAGVGQAVKRADPPDPDTAAALRREATTLRGLDHPHILRVLEVVEAPDGPAVVLPLAATTLARRLAEDGPLPADEVAELGIALAGALAAAHDAGVVHRDVKPSNVLFDVEGVALLGDFGAANAADDGAVVGTAEYLDPAVRAGATPGVRSDVYGLGVTLYEALAGVPPYAGSTVEATLRAADRGVAVTLAEAAPDAPDPLRDAIARAMARDPADRYGSARELARELAAGRLGPARATHGAGGPAERSGTRHFGPRPTPPPTRAAPEDTRRRTWLVLAAIAVALVPVVALVALPRLAGGEDPARPAPVRTTDGAVTPAAAAPPCADAVEPAERPGVRVLAGDLTGAGCSTWVTWSAGVLEVPRGAAEPADRFRMGEEGDLPVLGDWDCDGADTPAVYRPATGEVFVFDGFAGEGGELTSRPGYPTGRRDGRPVTRDVDGDGCDEVVVTPTGT